MTARISLILGKTGAHRAPLQLCLFNFFTASMTAATVPWQHLWATGWFELCNSATAQRRQNLPPLRGYLGSI